MKASIESIKESFSKKNDKKFTATIDSIKDLALQIINENPNIPSEEVFTTPHALKVNGHVKSTKPLSHQGQLIEDIVVEFEEGRISRATASKGQEVFLKLLDTYFKFCERLKGFFEMPFLATDSHAVASFL